MRLLTALERAQGRWLLPFGILVGFCLGLTAPTWRYSDRKAYALGALISQQGLRNQWKAAQIVGIPLSETELLAGVRDDLRGECRYRPEEIQDILNSFFEQLASHTRARLAQGALVQQAQNELYREEFLKSDGAQSLPSGLSYLIEMVGEGKQPTCASRVLIHCLGTLPTGVEFENSHKKGNPIVVQVNQLSSGLKEAILLLREGGRGRFLIPPKQEGVPEVQGWLQHFEIELLAVDPTIEQGV